MIQTQRRRYKMALLGRVENDLPRVPEGIYKAFLSGINRSKGEHGPILKIEFTLVTDGKFNRTKVSGITGTIISDKSKLGKWIKAIIGYMPKNGEVVNEEDILHQNCRVTIRHTENDDGRVFPNVVEVLPFDEEKQKK